MGDFITPSEQTRLSPTPGLAYGAGVADRLRSCEYAGRLQDADAVGEAGSAACGALVRIELRVRTGKVEEARYLAQGCPATLASASEVCATITGRSFLEAASLSQEAVSGALGLMPEREYTAGVALDALHGALTAALREPGCELSDPEHRADDTDRRGVLVGMSGGVDSAVAALLLKRAGRRVVGATLTFWNDPRVDDERSCCSPESVRRARRVAHSLGIPHLTVEARSAFYDEVVRYFLSEYGSGRTPNPCAKCNSRVRLGLLAEVAERLGLADAATGHYVRMVGTPPRLTRGADLAKDQSYVLAEVAPEILARYTFPLGGMTKPEVRRLAAVAGLEGHSVPESQEICFVPDDDHRRFLRENLGDRPGDIVNVGGRVLGRHEGIYNYTIGQRKGLGIAAAEPLYVIGLRAEERQVIIGTACEGRIGTVQAAGLVRHGEPGSGRLTLQVRSAGAPLPVDRLQVDEDAFIATLALPATGVAPGQTAVVYDEGRVVMAGTIGYTGVWDGG